jgi:hypothetical protein
LDQALRIIRDYVSGVEDERDRYSYIAATIRVNAMRHGATEDQIEAFLSGKQSFINWIVKEVEGADSRALLARAEKAEAERATAWNDAIEAAAKIAAEADDNYLAEKAILALIDTETEPQPILSGTSEPQAATATGADGYDQFWGALDDAAPRHDPVAQAIKALRSAWLVRDLTANDFRRALKKGEPT